MTMADERPEDTPPTEPAGDGQGAETPAALRAALDAKEAEIDELRDRLLRERAELENFKKRMQREKGEALRYAGEPLVRDLLPIVDNLERALDHAGAEGGSLTEGVQLVRRGLLELLERHGVQRIEAVGERFDPARHEAVAQAPGGGEPNHVAQQFLPGYQLHDRLLRPAQVSVATAPVADPRNDD